MAEKEPFDVIVVGSGAGGGMAVHELTKAGLKVLLLEAGRHYDPVTETPMFQIPADAPLRGTSTPEKPFGFFDATVDGGWEVPGEPYTTREGSEEFLWWRSRMLGGRTNHWGRISLRFGPYDFKPYDRDGLGVNWPIAYEDLEPWYDKTEGLIGIVGDNNGLENTPDSPPEVLHPLPSPRTHELFLKRGFNAMGIPTAGIRLAVITRPHNGRAACFYATPCGRGCSIGANFQTTTVLLPPAMKTGNLTVRTNAMVYGVDKEKGLATGVSYVDKTDGSHTSVRGKVVVLAASACETARILLNSRDGEGIANGSGLVGKYIMDTVGSSTGGQFPALEGLPPRNDDGMSICHIYAPWWGYQQQARGELDFPRGYHIELGGGARMPDLGVGDYADYGDVDFGPGLRDVVRRTYGSFIHFAGRGEMIPNDDCYMEIDPDTKDRYGIPVARFNWKWSEHEIRQAAHMRKTFHEVIDRLGGKVIYGEETDGREAIAPGGSIIHEVGGVRMGDSEKNSVVNSFGQSWEVKNLFVMDGGLLPSNPDKNPTLSILALAMRGSAYLTEAARKGELS